MTHAIFSFAEYRISIFFLLVFQLTFIELRYKKSISLLIAAISFITLGFIDYMYFFGSLSSYGHVIFTIIDTLIVQATAFFLCSYRDWRTFFTGLSSAAYVLVGNVTGEIIREFFGAQILSLIMQTLVHLIIIIYFCLKLRKPYHREMLAEKKGWFELSSIPLLFYLSIYSLTIWPNQIGSNRMNTITLVIILILMIFTYAIIVNAIEQRRNRIELEADNSFLQSYSDGLQKNVEYISQSTENAAVIRHDIRHITRMIAGYLDAGKIDDARSILCEIESNLDKTIRSSYSENIAVNAVITSLAEKAEKNSVKLQLKIDVPKNLDRINEYEFSAVVSNMLENAINAAAKIEDSSKRYVKINLLPFKNQILIDITNPYTGICEISPDTHLPIKPVKDGHGYGLRSIMAFAQKWNCFYECSAQDGIFRIYMLV